MNSAVASVFPATNVAHHDELLSSRVLAAYVIATPLLWATGLLIPMAGLLVIWLAIRTGARVLITPFALVWFLVALAQAVSVVVNGVVEERTIGFLLYRLMSSGVTGWIVLGLTLAVGAHERLATRAVVRAICVLGGYFFVFGICALLLHSATGMHEFELPTPPALLLPAAAPAVEFSFTMRLYSTEYLLGRELPRLVLFYPWAVVLGFAGIAVFFIAQLERSLPWRVLGCAGGLIAVVGSQGRAPMLGLLILIVVQIALLRSRREASTLVAAAALFALALLVPFGVTPADLVVHVRDAVTALRPGSSMARELGYALSMAGFLDSPVFGKGWVGGFVAPGIPMPVGTHSSFYGLLYTGGAVTFAAFIIALLTTLALLARRVRRGVVQRCALLVMLALALLAYGEGIYSFVLPCLPMLLFTGAALADHAAIASKVREESP